MPARVLVPALLVGVLGLVLVGYLVLRRVDPRAAAHRGPLWRRRLVGAGLALLASLGLGSTPARAAPAKPGSEKPSTSLERTPEWKQILAVWAEAEQVGSGKRGPYPFDEAGKKKLLAELEQAGKRVDALVARGVLGTEAGGLLKYDLATVTNKVQRMRPKEMMRATCYKPMALRPGNDAFLRLRARLPLLEKLAQAKVLQPAATRKILETIEADLDQLKGPHESYDLDQKQRKEAEGVLKASRKHVARIKALLVR